MHIVIGEDKFTAPGSSGNRGSNTAFLYLQRWQAPKCFDTFGPQHVHTIVEPGVRCVTGPPFSLADHGVRIRFASITEVEPNHYIS